MIALDRLDNDLAGWIDHTLVRNGLIAPAAFEDTFVAIVTSTAVDPAEAWPAFYRNTDAALSGEPVYGGTNAQQQPVHERAAALTIGPDVIELGCCFGFLALRLVRAGHHVTAVDLAPGTIALLARTAPLLDAHNGTLATLAADARAVPLPSGSADTVLAVHLLEHLGEEAGREVLAEMVRLARRRVVVAVPYEDLPNAAWGHVRRFDAAALADLGTWCARPYTVVDHYGGWLVVDV